MPGSVSPGFCLMFYQSNQLFDPEPEFPAFLFFRDFLPSFFDSPLASSLDFCISVVPELFVPVGTVLDPWVEPLWPELPLVPDALFPCD